jgi:sialate O-acetylesterase
MSIDRRLIAAALLGGLSAPTLATPQLHPLISDNAVLQRDRPLRLFGTASPRERLTIDVAGLSRVVRADKRGNWLIELPAMPAGGPHVVRVAGAGGSFASAQNVMLGDVWLCSGQSNMEWPLSASLGGGGHIAGASDEQLRITTIAKRTAISPETAFAEAPKWEQVTPKTVAEFSAACYFMGRDLRASHKVPIGLIDATWGGTPIRAWMNEAGVRSTGGAEAVELVAAYRRDPAAAARRFGENFGTWWRQQSGDPAGQEPWVTPGRLQWSAVPKISFYNDWGPEWANHNGSLWLRRSVVLTAQEARLGATLSLGIIDDLDQAFVNGVGIGSTNDWAAERNYRIAPAILRPGENEIIVFVRNSWGPGGLVGPAEKLKLTFDDGSAKPLGEGWQYAKVAGDVPGPPSAPWAGPNGAATIYNAMIAPLGSYGLKGAAWYQGETDVNVPGYDRRLAALFSNWRQQFRHPLPFLVVGLAGYGTPRSAPAASGWAAVVDEQRRGVQADRHAAFVPAIDLGEPTDIHPVNKLEVGRRLALAARAVAYSDPQGSLAPLPIAARRMPEAVEVTFSKPLQVLGGRSPVGFELCGATQESCRFRDARVSGASVVIANDGQPATRVRYAWADYPIVNLYDADLLPASTFEFPISD